MTTTSSTSSTTSTAATTTSSSTSSASSTSSTSAAAQAVLTSLGAGSGIDVASLVTSLTTAQYSTKTAQLQSQSDALDKQISDTATLLSNIKGFSSALTTLVTGGTLQTSPTSSNSGIVTATATSGAKLAGLSASIEVQQLAAAQSAASGVLSTTDAIGTGTLTLTLGSVSTASGGTKSFTAGSTSPLSITIDSSHATLAGIASQINAATKTAGVGVTASVVTDGTGARLVLRGATGAAQAFQLGATNDDGSTSGGLTQLQTDPAGTSAMTIGSTAQDAVVALDGVAFHRSSNQISDLISGVKLNLVTAQPGTIVTLGSTTPTDALKQAVSDFVDTYNQFHSAIAADLNSANGGTLTNDLAARTLNTSMQQLTSSKLVSNGAAGTPTTLAEIGVATAKDGSLSVNATQLANALANYPEAVEAMFTQSSDGSGDGLANKLTSISNAATSYTVGLNKSSTTYTSKKSDVTDKLSKLNDQETAYKTRLTNVYSAMDSRVSSYKSIQSFLTNQIAAWNKSTS